MGPPVEFFYGLGSRYSYLASTQLEPLAAETGCDVRWRPLFSGDLFAACGRDPFRGEPASGQYDWAYRRRDAERWADYYGVPYREPDDVTYDPRRLALAATAAARLGAVEPFSRRLHHEHTVLEKLKTGRAIQVIEKVDAPVGFAITVRVFQDLDSVLA